MEHPISCQATKTCALLMEQFITFDEYPVEHTHPVRRVTNITDEPNDVYRKIKKVFANKQSQAKFRTCKKYTSLETTN